MSDYVPPFTISNTMLELVSEISEKVGRINSHKELENKPYLRRNNRIRSIHSSLKIEANSLSLSEVRDVINGHLVMGDQKEIQEVKNAYEAYKHVADINPSSISDLKKIHGIMTFKTVRESGTFRKGEEGVFSGDECIFVAPPPRMVDKLMNNLLTWVKKSEGSVHPLILSSVFHYEFVFIHPFSDGNGRMARLWNTVILYRWRDIFEYIPLESQTEKFQDEYYNAIAACHGEGRADTFIEFMLRMIDSVLDKLAEQIARADDRLPLCVKKLMDRMEYDTPYTAAELMQRLELKSRNALRNNYLSPAMRLGLVVMTIPDKPNSRNQRYIKI